MARPLKAGVDYFPMDVDDDDKIELLEAKHGLEGYAILIKLWKKIYKEGYFIIWNEDIEMLFAKRINSSIELINAVVNECLRRNLFNNDLYKKYNILTSNGIQQRYFKICKDCKRKNINIISEYMLVKIDSLGLTTEETTINSGFNTEETTINSVESTQRIEENRKEKKKIYGEYKNVKLTDCEYQSLLKDYGIDNLNNLIKKVDEGIEARGYKYKNFKITIKNWADRDNIKKKIDKVKAEPQKVEVLIYDSHEEMLKANTK